MRDAAADVYAAAIRTPLVRLELPRDAGFGLDELYLKLEVLQPIGSFKIRGAYNVIRQLSPDELKDGVWTVSAGNAAQGVAFAARKAGARCSVMVMDTAPDTKLRAIERLGASIVRATYDECWQTVIAHALRPHDRPLRPPVRRRSVHRRQRHRRRSRFSRICRTSTRSSRRLAAAACSRASPRRSARCKPGHARLRGGAGDGCAARARRSPPAGRVYFDGWTAVVRRRRRRQVGARRRCGRCSRRSPDRSSCRSTRSARAMKLVAERAHVIAEGAAGCAIAAALSGRAGTGKVVAVVSGGNIDLARFAALIGAVTAMIARLSMPCRPSRPRIGRLDELAIDLWWSWHAEARDGLPPPRLPAVARDRAQPGADAAG